MARQPFQANITSFTKGLITEASPLTFPENASLEDVNFVLNRDGSRQRRYGMDIEEDYVHISSGYNLDTSTAAISVHIWTAVANRGDIEIAVIQTGGTLRFYFSNQGSISGNPANGGNTLTITGGDFNRIVGDSIYGHFIFTQGNQTVTILSYDPDTDSITRTNRRLSTRDLFGVEDSLSVNEQPTTLSNLHKYNLLNQGWVTSFVLADDEDGNSIATGDPIEYMKTKNDFYPSNADIMWTGKLSSAKEVKAIGSFWPNEVVKTGSGSSKAPMGKFAIDVFNRGSSRADNTGVTGLPADSSTGGVTSVAAYAGRLFYAIKETSRTGTDNHSPNLGSLVFFSMAKSTVDTFVKCYSEADPTAENNFDTVATDGGYITIPEAGEIVALVPMGQSLFVFATNGVWEIHGGEEVFSALNHTVSKTTDISVASPRSIVYAEDKIAFWGMSGIYLITRNDLTLRGGNTDLTYATIQTLFDDIDATSKKNSIGVYDPFTRTFRWLYRDMSLPNSQFFNSELIFDINLEAFYTFKLAVGETTPYVAGYLKMSDLLITTDNVQVLADNDNVKVSIDNVVVKATSGVSTYKGSVKYIAFKKATPYHTFSFYHYRNDKFKDWKVYDAPATLLTGYAVGSGAITDKRVNYIHVFMKRTGSEVDANGVLDDPSSCKMQVQWEWTNSPTAGRWGVEQEVYRLPRNMVLSSGNIDNFSYTTTTCKTKLRGHGRALSLLFRTTPEHNCVLYGWSVEGTEEAT